MKGGVLFITKGIRSVLFSVLGVMSVSTVGWGSPVRVDLNQNVQAQVAAACDVKKADTIGPVYALSTDPVGPFPLAALVPFPWDNIDGIWKLKLGGENLYFSLNGVPDCNGGKVLDVMWFDPENWREVSHGVGIANSDDAAIRAVLPTSIGAFKVLIGLFTTPTELDANKKTLYVYARPFDDREGFDVSMVATRESRLTFEQYKAHVEAQKARRVATRRHSGRP